MERHTDVVVIGAGPAGLTVAISLARAGVRTVLLERRTAPLAHPRATYASLHTMELLRSWGLADAVRAGGDEVTLQLAMTGTLSDLGRHVAVEVGVPSPEQAAVLSPTAPACAPQDHLERVLLEAARRLPAVTVQTGAEALVGTRGAHDVQVHVRDVATGTTSVVSAQYVVAADGARSATRHSVGIGSVSSGPVEAALSAVVRAPLWELVGEHRYLLYGLDGTRAEGTFLPAGDGDRWLYAVQWRPEVERLGDFPAEQVVDLVRQGAGVPDLPVTVEGVRGFTFEAEIADSFRDGRVLLVGDAAHRVTPRGGTGMNTAIASARNLAWKLAWVVDGWATEDLLDSYEAERRPLVEHNIARSLDPDGSRRPPGEEVHVDLAGRIAHHWVADEHRHRRSTLDLVSDRGVTLLTGPQDAAWRAAASVVHLPAPVTVHPLDAGTAVRLGVGRRGAMLVRPDGVPIWMVTDPSNAAGLMDRVADRLRSPLHDVG